MKKNVAALVLGIIGAIFAFLGGILWAACSSAVGTVADAVGDSGEKVNQTIYMAVYIILGIGGGVLSLIGSIQAFNLKRKPGLILSILGFVFQIGVLIASCIQVGGFYFALAVLPLIAIILLLIEVIMAARKPAQAQTEEQNNQNQQ